VASSSEIDTRIAKCQKILDSDPNSQIFAALAEALRRKGDLEKAFRVCQNGLKVHPSYGSAHVVMAKINLDRRLYDWAEIEAHKAAECDGWTRATELLLSEIYIYKGEFQPAIKLLTKLHESDPTNPHITKLLDIARQIPQQHAAVIGDTAPALPKPTEKRVGRPREATAATSPAVAPAASVAVEDDSPSDIDQTLEWVIALPGIDGALFTNGEGLVVKSEWTMRMDRNVCGAVACEISRKLDRTLASSCFGNVRTVLVETGDHTFYTVCAQDGMFVFVANSKANLGALRMKLGALLTGQSRN